MVEAIKSLFIPSNEFLSNFFNDLKKWFSDRLGFLFYPFELIIDILNKMLNINFSNPVFNISDIYEPFTNKLLISSTTYNLFQNRGAVHYHVLSDIPYVPQQELQELWGQGLVYINAISHVDNIRCIHCKIYD